jgi:two-component system cell cycle response regulator DivK
MKHILVVEDDTVNALLFRMILEKRGGHRVSVTESPGQVLEMVQSGAVDLVIMDVSLSNSRYQEKPINGAELCRLIKNDPRWGPVPLILATAHAMRGDAENLVRESGADDYIAKPIIDHAAFIQQVDRHLRRAA